MSSTILMAIVLVVMWLVVLVPMFVRRGEDRAELPVDGQVRHRDARAVPPRAVQQRRGRPPAIRDRPARAVRGRHLPDPHRCPGTDAPPAPPHAGRPGRHRPARHAGRAGAVALALAGPGAGACCCSSGTSAGCGPRSAASTSGAPAGPRCSESAAAAAPASASHAVRRSGRVAAAVAAEDASGGLRPVLAPGPGTHADVRHRTGRPPPDRVDGRPGRRRPGLHRPRRGRAGAECAGACPGVRPSPRRQRVSPILLPSTRPRGCGAVR